MKTPFGFECPYFFGDYYRGRKREECRLLEKSDQVKWNPDICKTCPVPSITLANACPNMTLKAQVKRTIILAKRMDIKAWCKLSQKFVSEPHIGCGQCHTLTLDTNEESK
jgi:TusA-related sulfurtransferase